MGEYNVWVTKISATNVRYKNVVEGKICFTRVSISGSSDSTSYLACAWETIISRGLKVQRASLSHPGGSGWKPVKNNLDTDCRVLDQANRSRFIMLQYSAIKYFWKISKTLKKYFRKVVSMPSCIQGRLQQEFSNYRCHFYQEKPLIWEKKNTRKGLENWNILIFYAIHDTTHIKNAFWLPSLSQKPFIHIFVRES